MRRTPALEPLTLAAHWREHFWTTNPPRYDPHTEWIPHLTIAAAEPLRVALVIGNATFVKDPGRGQKFTLLLGKARPIAPGGTSPWSELGVAVPLNVTTWRHVPVRAASEGQPSVGLFAVPRRDTELLRCGRWRIRRDLWSQLDDDASALRCGTWSR